MSDYFAVQQVLLRDATRMLEDRNVCTVPVPRAGKVRKRHRRAVLSEDSPMIMDLRFEFDDEHQIAAAF